MADKQKIEAAIDDRLIRALDEDLDEEQVQQLEHKVNTIRALADD